VTHFETLESNRCGNTNSSLSLRMT
jgi:hypothetical protein